MVVVLPPFLKNLNTWQQSTQLFLRQQLRRVKEVAAASAGCHALVCHVPVTSRTVTPPGGVPVTM